MLVHLVLFNIFVSVFLQGSTFEEMRSYADIYGATVETYPNYEERYQHHMFNIVRLDCEEYHNLGYGTIDPSVVCTGTEWPNQPLFIHPKICEAARFHCHDLATDCGGNCAHNNTSLTFKGLSHDSCDGTNAGTRVNRFIQPGCSYSGEIAAMGYSYSRVTDGWLCEGAASQCWVGGHTRAIMNGGYIMVGPGDYGRYQTADFSRCAEIFSHQVHPIASGIASYSGGGGPDTNNPVYSVKFMALFHNPDCKEVRGRVRIDGQIHKLSPDIMEGGNLANSAHYVTTIEMAVACQTYYFDFKCDGETYTYPKVGSLVLAKNNLDMAMDCDNEIDVGYNSKQLVAENFVVAGVVGGLLGLGAVVVLIALIVVIFFVAFFAFFKARFLKNRERYRAESESNEDVRDRAKKFVQKKSFKKTTSSTK